MAELNSSPFSFRISA